MSLTRTIHSVESHTVHAELAFIMPRNLIQLIWFKLYLQSGISLLSYICDPFDHEANAKITEHRVKVITEITSTLFIPRFAPLKITQ